MQATTRPPLRSIPLADVFPARRGACYITLAADQWDTLLQLTYDRGWILIEVDDLARPVRAYQRPSPEVN